MFKSATLKLTIWYALILVCISILFSVIIYSIATSELGSLLDYMQETTPFLTPDNPAFFEAFRNAQIHQAESNLIGALVITNLSIWIAGGIGSYYLARKTLRPIEEAHDAQSRFTSDASHELRTPLASMKVELEVALRDPNMNKSEMYELLESNLEEVNKLTKLSHTLLQLSRLDHGNIDRGKVDLSKITTSVVERFNKIHNRIVIHDAKKLHVHANESNVEELVTILVDNALKYSPKDSQIDITLIKQKNMSGFKVVNAGEGIPADTLPYIFNRFYRADASRTKSAIKGYGLGLSLAKKIVQLHEGELTVSSAPKQNTSFTILLPNYKRNLYKPYKSPQYKM